MEKTGEKIAFYRKKNGFSRQYLADNICDESTLYRIEKGQQLPRLDILKEICMKLNIPIEYILSDNDEAELISYVQKFKRLCRESLYQLDFITLQYHYEEAKNFSNNNPLLNNRQFLRFLSWIEAVLYHKRDQNPEKAEILLRKLIQNGKIINEIDINITNSLGLLLLEQNKLKEALRLFSSSYKALENSPYIEDKSLFPRVAYNLACLYYENHRDSECFDICYRLEYYLQSNHLFYCAGEVRYLLGILHKRKNDLDIAQQYFDEAVNIFSFERKYAFCSQSLHSLAEIHYLKGDSRNGELHVNKALSIADSINDQEISNAIKKEIKHTKKQYASRI
ncbi:helix-turn-helix domain-containing protein [Cytobacillus kochii]|uniref:helix-turn-helix domain-containing protein n=1 Tax=Cytobacillus kochii TaxID=859143 RepID=UPI00204147E1|nr:helix-turn-helix transcriptional regulator [Cytobacillus kochii]MCM3322423.1 helix-turn-helix domain-containing protein [Cytobacillus kochii]MCM3345099.1 helix-turn-helix domain-containing protein [Cytobacillus kochii]